MLFCEIWKCLTILIENHSINLKETFMLIYIQKINLSLISFLQYCRRNNIFVILGNLGMPATHTQQDTINL